MQNAKRGKVHQSWEDIFDSANGAPLVRVMILGNTTSSPRRQRRPITSRGNTNLFQRCDQPMPALLSWCGAVSPA